MKVITLYQPWATWIIWGWKTIETRTHNKFTGLKGQRIAIHAGREYDKMALEAAYRYLTDEQIVIHQNYAREKLYPQGKILGTAQVVDSGKLNAFHSSRALIDCGMTLRHGLFLADVKELLNPIPASGHQGIWEHHFKGDEQFVQKLKTSATS